MLAESLVEDFPAVGLYLNSADRVAAKLCGKTIRDIVATAPDWVVVNWDDTLIEVAGAMARSRCPPAVVTRGDALVRPITRVPFAALSCDGADVALLRVLGQR